MSFLIILTQKTQYFLEHIICEYWKPLANSVICSLRVFGGGYGVTWTGNGTPSCENQSKIKILVNLEKICETSTIGTGE